MPERLLAAFGDYLRNERAPPRRRAGRAAGLRRDLGDRPPGLRAGGLPEVGAHRLRHTAACQMAEDGAPLAEIGQVPRHRSLEATANYARVSIAQLRTLAVAWSAASVSAKASGAWRLCADPRGSS